MFLYDLRLKFARDLVGHWLDIRGGALVPLEEDIDPRALLGCFDYVALADLTLPRQTIFQLAGASVSRRFGRDLRRVNWLDLVPPMLGDAGERAREHIRGVPCGYYHRFAATSDATRAVAAETLVLPLRHRIAAVPKLVVGITREVEGDPDNTPAGWLTPASRIDHFFNELVDIGAGGAADR